MTPNEGGPVTVARDGGVLRLILSHPPANALSLDTMAALKSTLDAAAADRAVRVVVIAAAGKVFSGGHDLKEMTAHRDDPDRGRAFFQRTFAACAELMQAIVGLSKPVIAEVDGIATAAGCQLVASCDLAIASDRARFGVNGIDVGLFCSTPAVALARTVQRKHALDLLLTGELIDAGTAREIGLVNRVVPGGNLAAAVAAYAATIAAKSPQAVAFGKRAFHRQAAMDLPAAYDLASSVMIENMLAEDAEEGIAAFIEKRVPKWKEE